MTWSWMPLGIGPATQGLQQPRADERVGDERVDDGHDGRTDQAQEDGIDAERAIRGDRVDVGRERRPGQKRDDIRDRHRAGRARQRSRRRRLRRPPARPGPVCDATSALARPVVPFASDRRPSGRHRRPPRRTTRARRRPSASSRRVRLVGAAHGRSGRHEGDVGGLGGHPPAWAGKLVEGIDGRVVRRGPMSAAAPSRSTRPTVASASLGPPTPGVSAPSTASPAIAPARRSRSTWRRWR